MTLGEINQKLEEIAETYPDKLNALREAESAYYLRFWDLSLRSGLGTVGAREAEASLACQTEGLTEPMQILKADVRALFHQKECYMEIARNLRTLGGNEKGFAEHA